MGLRFYRRVPLLPGVRLNVSGSGPSVSFGHRGAWYTWGPHGRRTATLGWPGTGLRYSISSGGTPGSPKPGVPPPPSALRTLLWLLGIVVGVLWITLR
jgi:hypothetical protein